MPLPLWNMCENNALYLCQIKFHLIWSFFVVHDQVKRFAIYSVICFIKTNFNNLKLKLWKFKIGSVPRMPVAKFFVLNRFNVIAKSNHTSLYAFVQKFTIIKTSSIYCVTGIICRIITCSFNLLLKSCTFAYLWQCYCLFFSK